MSDKISPEKLAENLSTLTDEIEEDAYCLGGLVHKISKAIRAIYHVVKENKKSHDTHAFKIDCHNNRISQQERMNSAMQKQIDDVCTAVSELADTIQNLYGKEEEGESQPSCSEGILKSSENIALLLEMNETANENNRILKGLKERNCTGEWDTLHRVEVAVKSNSRLLKRLEEYFTAPEFTQFHETYFKEFKKEDTNDS